MKLRLPFRTIRGQLAILFLLVAAGPLFLFGSLGFQQRAEAIKAQALEKLVTARDLKIGRINDWLDELSGDLETISVNTRHSLLPTGTLPIDGSEKAIGKLRAYLLSYTRFHPGVSDLVVLDGATAKVLAATTGKFEGEDLSDSPSFTEPLKTRRLFIYDVHNSPITGRPRMAFSVPALPPGANGPVVAVIVANIDLKLLDDLFNERTGLGETGETLIVNRDVVTVNEVRWMPNSRLRLKSHAAPAILASQGKTGVVEATDYRNVPVLAAYGYIPRTGWGFVAKQDLEEVYAPVARLERALLLLVPACLLLVGVLAVFVAGTFARPLVEMRTAAEAFGRGDLKARSRVDRSDELGGLGRAFNAMANSVERETAVSRGNRDVLASMVEPTTVDEFCRDVLPMVVRVTRSDLGAFYIPTGDGRLVAAASVGVSAPALEAFEGNRLEGALGEAVASRKVTHLRDIPEDTRFTFRTVAGTAVPREMLTIPVTVREELVAVLALASLRAYPPEVLTIVDKSLVAFGIGFSNILAGEETRRLADDLAARNSELTAQGAELSAQAVELSRQSAALKDQNLELEVQSAQVAEANRMKSEFLSNMSHELRTPLNSVLALSRVLQMQGRDHLTREETGYLEIIERNGKQLLALINDVLDLAKIESGRTDVLLEPVVVAERIRAIREGLEPVCREKGVGFVVEVEEGLPPLVTDVKRLHQILQNVIGNAVKFTREGSVTVTVHRCGGELEVVVTDTGIGIPEKELPHIFEEFRQVDGTTSRSFEGTGLGLAIASRSAYLLGGRIGVTSVSGAGSTFTIAIPFTPASPADHEARPAVAAPLTADGRRTVLVVDDEPEDSALIAAHLSREGFAAVVAHGGREALRLAREVRPFAITLDVLMPEMDGWEILQALKESPTTSAIPVIVVSMSPDRETGRALGAVGVVAKPVDPVALVAELSRVANAPASTAIGTRGGGNRLLLVEDSEPAIVQIRVVLEAEGYVVDVARGGREALERMRTNPPDGILLDLMMPQVDGFTVLDRMRGTPETAHTPVLILTAKDLTREELGRLNANHVHQLIRKGDVDRAELVAAAARLVGRDLGGRRAAAGTAPAEAHSSRTRRRSASGNAARVLAVEDNPDNMSTLRAILKDECLLLEARSAEDGIFAAKTREPDLILLDMSLPGQDGLSVVARLRADEATRDIPVIALTAHAMKGDREAYLAAGCDGYLAKPIDVEGLLAAVKEWTAPRERPAGG